MQDLISRQVAIDALGKHLRMTDVPVRYPGIISALTEWLNELSPAQPEPFVDADKLKRCRFEYINACKIVAHPTPDTSKNDIYDAYAVMKALHPIFGDAEF